MKLKTRNIKEIPQLQIQSHNDYFDEPFHPLRTKNQMKKPTHLKALDIYNR